MKEFKGTPGNWQVVDDYGKGDYCVDDPQIYIWNGDEQAHKPICDMGKMGDMNYGEELANAKLIAAAPELLQALQKVAQDVDSNQMWEYVDYMDIINVLNKALTPWKR